MDNMSTRAAATTGKKNHPSSKNTSRMPLLEQKASVDGNVNNDVDYDKTNEDAITISTAVVQSTAATTTATTAKKKQYRCDICKVLTFPTMEQACRHEEECRTRLAAAGAARNTDATNNNESNSRRNEKGESPLKKRKTNAAVATADTVDRMDTEDISSSSIEATIASKSAAAGNGLSAAATTATTTSKGDTKKAKSTTAKAKPTTTATRKRPAARSAPTKEKEGEESKSKPKAVASKKKTTTATANAFFSASTYARAGGAAAKKSSSAALTVTKKTSSSSSSSVGNGTTTKTGTSTVANNKAKAAKIVATKTAPAAKKAMSCQKDASLLLAPLFFEGADHDTLLAEHVAAEYQAKRRLRDQEERERQARRKIALRQLQQQQQQQPQYGAATANTVVKNNKFEKYPLACRFPEYSHVHPKVDCRSNTHDLPVPCAHWWNDAMKLKAQSALQKAWLPGSEPPPPVLATAETTSFALRSDAIRLEHDDHSSMSIVEEESAFPFQSLTDLLIHPSPRPAVEASTDSNTLWTDKYSFATGSQQQQPCGASLQHAFQSLHEMVHEWKIVRQGANERMAERQRALASKSSRVVQKKKTTTRKKQRYADDYDDWMDSDDEEREQDGGGLSSICLITGPVASGKTSLVHAVARHADCLVLEINTLQKRGAAALRKILEEATQSHSSLDMLQKQQQKRQQASIFATAALQQQALVDTDDENDESSCGADSDNNSNKGSNVTIVLLDEVDLLFAEDAGFWNALSDVTKRAKSPIILTAERLPEEMKSSSAFCNYKHIHVERPTPDECVLYLRNILQSEGFSIQPGMEAQLDNQLLLLAEFYNSDLRRLFHKLQLTLLSSDSKQTSPKGTVMARVPADNRTKETQQAKVSQTLPQLESIHPKSIPSSQFSLVTITGSGFLSLAAPATKSATMSSQGGADGGFPVLVEVGKQHCPKARIMDDSTILAVVPPCESRSNVDSSGNFCYTNIRCLTACYAPVQVHGVNKMGLLSSTKGGMVSSTELVDGTKVATFNAIVNLEYHFAPTAKSSLLNNGMGESSDSEAEFEDANPIITNASTASCHQPTASTTISSDNQKIIDTLLQEGLTAWRSRHGNDTVVEQMSLVCDETNGPSCLDDSSSAVQEIDYIAELASDAALLEDGALASIPHLSGAVRGFGFELTDAFPLYNNQKSKFPSEDSLFASGWKDTAFFHGCSNAHVRLPTSRRGRILMHRSEMMIRGKAFRSEEPQQDQGEAEEGSIIFWENSEEDMYLANPRPHSLSSLPYQLKKVATDKAGAIGATLISQDPLFDRKMLATLDHGMDMLEMCDSRLDFAWLKLFAPRISRQFDPMLNAREMLDNRVVLDYLPLLRCMAVLERAADVASLDDDPLSQELSQASACEGRLTRRGRKRGRVHYFEQAFECFSSTDVNNKQAKNVGDMFAAAAALFTIE